ncbi:hypothetical protein N9I81_03610 [Planktomarina temperata]|nr:hypothetical protein [Planktomarina temperata]
MVKKKPSKSKNSAFRSKFKNVDISASPDWGDILSNIFFPLLLLCVAVFYSYFISDRTISQGYNESLYENVAYPETINHLSDIRYIYKKISSTENLNERREYYGFEAEFKENEEDSWTIFCIESLIEFRNQEGQVVQTTVSYTQAEDSKVRAFTNSAYVSGKASAKSCDERFNVAEGVIWLRLGDRHWLFGTESLTNALFEFSPAWVNQTFKPMF